MKENPEMIQDTCAGVPLNRRGKRWGFAAALLAAGLLGSGCAMMQTEQTKSSVDLSSSYAVKSVAQTSQVNPEGKSRDPRAYFYFLKALREEWDNQFEAAAEHYSQVVKYDPTREEFFEKQVLLLLKSSRFDDAIKAAEEALRHFPDNVTINLIMGSLQATRGENSRALAFFQRVLWNHPQNSEALLLSGTILVEQGQYSSAKEMFQKVVAEDPTNPLGHYYLGRAFLRENNLEESQKSFRKAVALRPNYLQAREHLALVLGRRGEFDEAVKEYKVLLKLAPHNQRIQKKLDALEKSRFSSSSSADESGQSKLPDTSDIHLTLGAIFYEQAMYLDSLDEFQLVLARGENKEPRQFLVRIFEILGRLDLAVEQLKALRKLNPNSVVVLLQAARLYNMMGKTEESVRLLEESIQVQPENDALYHSLALAKMQVNQYDQAIEHMRTAIQLNPKDSYYFELGALLERKGDYEAAIKHMKHALELNPMHSNAHNFIGYLYAIEGKNLDQARTHLEKALAIQPRKGYFLDSLGWIYFKQGDPERALVEVKKAMIYTSPDPVLYDHLGDILFSLKDFVEARKAWNNSLSLTRAKPDNYTGEMPDPGELENKIKKVNTLLGNNI